MMCKNWKRTQIAASYYFLIYSRALLPFEDVNLHTNTSHVKNLQIPVLLVLHPSFNLSRPFLLFIPVFDEAFFFLDTSQAPFSSGVHILFYFDHWHPESFSRPPFLSLKQHPASPNSYFLHSWDQNRLFTQKFVLWRQN